MYELFSTGDLFSSILHNAIFLVLYSYVSISDFLYLSWSLPILLLPLPLPLPPPPPLPLLLLLLPFHLIPIHTTRLSGTHADPRSPPRVGYSEEQCSLRSHTRGTELKFDKIWMEKNGSVDKLLFQSVTSNIKLLFDPFYPMHMLLTRCLLGSKRDPTSAASARECLQ